MSTQPELPYPLPDFDGDTYERPFDYERLGKQARSVFLLMSDGRWRTLPQISRATGCPEASVSARLRDFRKRKFGSHTVERRSVGSRTLGLYEYRLLERQP